MVSETTPPLPIKTSWRQFTLWIAASIVCSGAVFLGTWLINDHNSGQLSRRYVRIKTSPDFSALQQDEDDLRLIDLVEMQKTS